MEFLMTSIPESLLLIWEYTPSVLATTLFVLFFFLVINSFGLCPQSFPCFCHSLLFLLNQARKHRRTAHFPDRIILIRHGESLGNVDGNVYSSVPDNQIPLTQKGEQQAQDAGVRLKEILGDDNITFYVSPFLRSRQTYHIIAENFPESQFISREEVRLREQEWANYQDPEEIRVFKQERNEIGSFFYRFPNADMGNVVIVSHGITIRLFLMRYFRWSVEYFQSLWNIDNCGFVVLEKDSEGRYELKTQLTSDLPDECEKVWKGHRRSVRVRCMPLI